MSLSFEAKTQAMRRQLATRQIAPGIIAPPLWRLLWKLGIPLTPPLFLGFMPLALLCGGFFAVLWGLVMYLASWRANDTATAAMLVGMLTAGVLFGLIMATVYRRHASGLQLPAWSDYTGTN